MADLFSEEWANGFKDRWNADSDLAGALEKIGFNSNIGYGFDGEAKPRCFIRVENGRVTEAGSYGDQELNWDLRATAENWQKWMTKPPGMMGLGMAYILPRFRARYEKLTDFETIKHGLGWQLLEFAEFARSRPSVTEKTIGWMDRFYLNPDEIRMFMDEMPELYELPAENGTED